MTKCTECTNGGENMQLMFGVVSYIFILFGMYHRSVISFILAPLSIAMLFFHYKEYKVITVVLMLLQGLLTAFMVYLRMQGIVHSDYLLYVSAISVLMLFSMTVEMFIQQKQKATA